MQAYLQSGKIEQMKETATSWGQEYAKGLLNLL